MRKSFLLIFFAMFSGTLIFLNLASGIQYALFVDESAVVGGKVVTLKNINLTESVIVEIDGSTYTITGTGTHDDLIITVINANPLTSVKWARLDIEPATPTTNICEDSDGGKYHYTRGCVTVCPFSGQVEDCETLCDFCSSSGSLSELYCKDGYITSIKYGCSFGCEDGACENPCYGDITLTLNPNPVKVSSDVYMGAGGVHYCYSESFVFRKDSCYGSDVCSADNIWHMCGVIAEGMALSCSCIFDSPDTPGDYTYFACFDKNIDGDYDDPGEYNSEVLTVSETIITYTTTTTLPTTISTSTTTTTPTTTEETPTTIPGETTITVPETTTTTQEIIEEQKKPNIFIRVYQRILNFLRTLVGKWYKVFD